MLNEYSSFDLASFIQSFLILLMVGYTWWSRRDSAKAAELDNLKQEVTQLKERIKHLPDCKQVGQIEAELKGLSSQLQTMNSTLQLLQNYLLKSK